ncbi:hypothetical protein NDA16_001740 [Ustilago loliicola]|nr:hypothetical protein NDA16_001740 [Ustilago loliicola]
MVPPSSSKPSGPIKSERNRAAAAAGRASSAGPASSTSSAFHKKRAQGRDSYGNHSGPSGSSHERKAYNGNAPTGRKDGQRMTAGRQGDAQRKEQSKPQAAKVVDEDKPAAEPAHEDEDSDEEEEEEEDEDIRSKTVLSLSGHQLPPLAALVDTLSQFRYLQRLDLSSIEPSEASPEGLTTLTWLAKAVFRSKASSKGKSRAFGDNLTWLNLSTNPNLTSEACVGLEALEELCVLTLSHCKLTSIPLSINPLRNLKALVLNNNDIQSLPKSFPHLPDLNSLILSHNELTSLPASLPASLPSLKKLSLGHNKLSGSESLPDFSLCLALREVRLNDNPELKALPSHVKSWGTGADGKTAPGLELLELKDCGLDTWDSLSTLVEADSEKEQQPRLRRKGLTQLLLKGNGVTQKEGYKERILQVHPTLRVLDNERLQPRVKLTAEGAEEKKTPKAGKAEGEKGKGIKEGKVQQRAQRAQREAEAEDDSEEEDEDEAAQMAAEMRALRRGKPAPAQEESEDDEDDDDEAAQMAAEMRALRRGQAPPASGKKDAAKSKHADKAKDGDKAKRDDKASTKNGKPNKRDAKSKASSKQAQHEEDSSKPKHKRGTRAGKKVKKSDPADADTSTATPQKEFRDKSAGFFEEVDATAEKARLAPIYELSKKRAKIASGRTEVAEGVLEDATATLSKARQKESKARMELDTYDESIPSSNNAIKDKAKHGKGGKKSEEVNEKATPVNTSVAGIIDLRKSQQKGKKRKAAGGDADEGKKKARASLPFVPAKTSVGEGGAFGSGADGWGDGGAWA